MMYAALARVYDLLSYDFDYPAWIERYEALIRRVNPNAHEICDAGCGTGALTIGLSQKGYKLTGIDLSGDMLSVASDKARKAGQQIAFVKQDMRALALPHPVDAVISACDGVNYLTKPEAVKSFFSSARACLKPGGALAFDISNEKKLTDMGAEGIFAEETDECAYLWQNEFNEETRLLRMDLSFYIKAPDGRYDRYEETHRQRAWRSGEIGQLLLESGLCDIAVLGSDAGDEKRIFFSAKKPE